MAAPELAPAVSQTIAPEIRVEPQAIAPAVSQTIAPEVRIEPEAIAPAVSQTIAPEIRVEPQAIAPAVSQTIAPEIRVEPQAIAPAAPETIAPEVRVEPQAVPELLEGYSPEYRDMIAAWRAREQELLAQQREQKMAMDVCTLLRGATSIAYACKLLCFRILA
jgi:hypothetical protein